MSLMACCCWMFLTIVTGFTLIPSLMIAPPTLVTISVAILAGFTSKAVRAALLMYLLNLFQLLFVRLWKLSR